MHVCKQVVCAYRMKRKKKAYLARSEVLKAEERNLVGGLDLVVIGGVGEGEWEHALLLQVSLYKE